MFLTKKIYTNMVYGGQTALTVLSQMDCRHVECYTTPNCMLTPESESRTHAHTHTHTHTLTHKQTQTQT